MKCDGCGDLFFGYEMTSVKDGKKTLFLCKMCHPAPEKKELKSHKDSFVDEEGGVHLGTDFVDAYHQHVKELEKAEPELRRFVNKLIEDLGLDDD